ncbi:MAG: hypothetical protein IPM79_06475 [Polyangiaceae bacterium]|jgi:hypothetical protein|nr:hypothetical protein [Polyangiaceae bacterium]
MTDPLPPVYQGALGPEGLARLFEDVASAGQLLSVSVKQASTARAAFVDCSVESAMGALLDGTAMAVQLRYRFEGQVWCDSVLRGPPAPEGPSYRVVRIAMPDPAALR